MSLQHRQGDLYSHHTPKVTILVRIQFDTEPHPEPDLFLNSQPQGHSPGILRLCILRVMADAVCRLWRVLEERWGYSVGFNALEFFPDHPDEMGLW